MFTSCITTGVPLFQELLLKIIAKKKRHMEHADIRFALIRVRDGTWELWRF